MKSRTPDVVRVAAVLLLVGAALSAIQFLAFPSTGHGIALVITSCAVLAVFVVLDVIAAQRLKRGGGWLLALVISALPIGNELLGYVQNDNDPHRIIQILDLATALVCVGVVTLLVTPKARSYTR